ncbi:hypothetical protein PRZ48_001702 [Zasmidium cellare]|uniref:Uncharacterized protein n=1 Tax=Zasmidium cellare TaxID=395010 RepID=A0ABR0F2N5_ZASCE|nr:hypothetical protein PRZ48_001702 [Zasmidium cellare]
MAIHLSTNGHSVPSIKESGVNNPSEDVVQSILPQVLEAVGNGYNHVEGRLNDVQNKRVPSLEAQMRAFEQSQAQFKGTASQLSNLKDRVKAAEEKEAFLETLTNKFSESIRKLEANKSALTSDAARIKTLSSKVDQLQADTDANTKTAQDAANIVKTLPPEGTIDWTSLSAVLDTVKSLSETVKKFQGEKEADARRIQTLSETVKKLQSDKVADGVRSQGHSERLDKLEKQQADGEQATKMETISQDVKKLQEDRVSAAGRTQLILDGLNKLQSQQAEKANRTSVTVLTEKVAKLQSQAQAGDPDRKSDADIVRKQNRKLEERIENVDKQLKNLNDQSRKVEAANSDVTSVKTATISLVRRLENLETHHTSAANSNTATQALFKRVDKLENRDDNIARVNADSQALLKRVEKMTGDGSETARIGANVHAMMKRVQKLEDREAAKVKADGEKEALLKRLEKLEANEDDIKNLVATNKTLNKVLQSRIEDLDKHKQEEQQPRSLSLNELARQLLQRLSQGEVFDEETKSLIRIATGNSAVPKGQKAPEGSIRSLSTNSPDVLSAKESIEKSTPLHDLQKQARGDKEPQDQLKKPSLNRQSSGQHQLLRPETANQSTSKRKFDMSNQDNDTEQASTGSRKRSKSVAGNGRTSKRGATEEREPRSKLQKLHGRHVASSPIDIARSAGRRKETSAAAGATEEEESDEEAAPRRTSRTVKPTERGSNLPFIEESARRNS